jgi:hypothetical protein
LPDFPFSVEATDGAACVQADFELVPLLVGRVPAVRVVGLDPLDPACGRVVLGAGPAATLPAARLGIPRDGVVPADRDAAVAELESSGRWSLAGGGGGLRTFNAAPPRPSRP